MIIAPRHPERFDEVAGLLKSTKFVFARRTAADLPTLNRSDPRKADLILLDSIGELTAVYDFASVVFIGGSLVSRGGHNVLEPALCSKPIVVGPHMQNFRDITNEFLKREALIQLRAGAHPVLPDLVDELSDTFFKLLDDPLKARTLGENARRAIEDNRGATERTLDAVSEVMRSTFRGDRSRESL